MPPIGFWGRFWPVQAAHNPSGSDDVESKTPAPIANGVSMSRLWPVESVEVVFDAQDAPQSEVTPRPRQGLCRPTPVWRVLRDGKIVNGVEAPQRGRCQKWLRQ